MLADADVVSGVMVGETIDWAVGHGEAVGTAAIEAKIEGGHGAPMEVNVGKTGEEYREAVTG